MSLRLRLALLSLFFIGSIAAVAAIGYNGSSDLVRSLDRVATVQLPAVRAMTLIDMMHDGLRAVAYRALYISTGTVTAADADEVREELKEMSSNLNAYVKQIKELPLSAKTGTAIESALPSVEAYINQCSAITELALKGDRAGSAALIPALQASFKALEERLETLGASIEEESSEINSASRSTPNEVLLLSLLTTLFGSAVAFFVVWQVSRQLGQMFGRLQSVAHQLSETSHEMLNSSDSLTQASSGQANAVQEVSSNMEELSATVEVGVKGSRQSVELAHKVNASMTEGAQSMGDLDASMSRIAEANARVERLAKLIEEIGEKTELIDEIVFQTKLLSFNASVEAERAGEHGRGFSVVAQEVGNLAQMSGQRASEIRQIVKGSMAEARDVAQLNRERVQQGVSLCAKTAEKIKSTESFARDILQTNEHMLRSYEEQSSAIRQASTKLQDISQSTSVSSQAAEAAGQSSQTLSQQGQALIEVLGDLAVLAEGRSKVRAQLSQEGENPSSDHERSASLRNAA